METEGNGPIATGGSAAAEARPPRAAWTANVSREGVAALLEASPTHVPADMKVLFPCPKAENADIVERMLLEVYRDYVFWRRNFHLFLSNEDRTT